MFGSLSDVVSPLSVADFLRAFRDKRRLHIQATDAARAQSLLPWRELETMISLRGFDDIEVMRNGMVIPPQLYQAEPDTSAFHDILAQGSSVIIHQIDLRVPQIQWLAAAIERELGVAVGVNAYLSFSQGGAFKPHWDRHDVLVIQVHGQKSWKIWDATFENPVEKSRYAKHDITAAPAQELTLSAGDVLYIPRGEPHAAAVSSGDSVHLSFGLDSLNGLDMLRQLSEGAGQDEFLRTDLPQAAEEIRAHEAEQKARLHRLVDALDVAAFLHADDANRQPLRRVSLTPSEQPDDLLRLTLRRRIPLPDVGPVIIGGVSYPLSPAAIDILRLLLARDRQPRQAVIEALAPRHETATIATALTELSRLGLLVTDGAI